jgi:hypothetical protein
MLLSKVSVVLKCRAFAGRTSKIRPRLTHYLRERVLPERKHCYETIKSKETARVVSFDFVWTSRSVTVLAPREITQRPQQHVIGRLVFRVELEAGALEILHRVGLAVR